MQFKKFKNKQTIIIKHRLKSIPFVQVRDENGLIIDAVLTFLENNRIKIDLNEKTNGVITIFKNMILKTK